MRPREVIRHSHDPMVSLGSPIAYQWLKSALWRIEVTRISYKHVKLFPPSGVARFLNFQLCFTGSYSLKCALLLSYMTQTPPPLNTLSRLIRPMSSDFSTPASSALVPLFLPSHVSEIKATCVLNSLNFTISDCILFLIDLAFVKSTLKRFSPFTAVKSLFPSLLVLLRDSSGVPELSGAKGVELGRSCLGCYFPLHRRSSLLVPGRGVDLASSSAGTIEFISLCSPGWSSLFHCVCRSSQCLRACPSLYLSSQRPICSFPRGPGPHQHEAIQKN